MPRQAMTGRTRVARETLVYREPEGMDEGPNAPDVLRERNHDTERRIKYGA